MKPAPHGEPSGSVSAFTVYKKNTNGTNSKSKRLKEKLAKKKSDKKFKEVFAKFVSSNPKIKEKLSETNSTSLAMPSTSTAHDKPRKNGKKKKKDKKKKSKSYFTDEQAESESSNTSTNGNSMKTNKASPGAPSSADAGEDETMETTTGTISRKSSNDNLNSSTNSKKNKKKKKKKKKSKRAPTPENNSSDKSHDEDDERDDNEEGNEEDSKEEGNERDNKKEDNEKGDEVDEANTEVYKLFEWLIYPMTPSMFLEKYWEKKAFSLTRGEPKYYKNVLTTQTFDRMIRDNILHYTRNIDVVTYENEEKIVHNLEGRAVPNALWDYYYNGCSIRLLNPQRYNLKVHLILSVLQEYFGSMAGANVYLTPPLQQGFAPHYDDIEAFVIQLEGHKHWKLYHSKHTHLARESSRNFKRDEIGEPYMEVTLQPGDLLYFPRGTIHEAQTDATNYSLHMTLSVYQYTTYTDLLKLILPDALETAALDEIEFRRGLPLHYLRHLGSVSASSPQTDTFRSEMKSKINSLIENLTKYVNMDSAADIFGRRLMRDGCPPFLTSSEIVRTSTLDGAFMKNGGVLNRIEITLETKVRLIRYYCIRLGVATGTVTKLYYNTENGKGYQEEDEQWLEIDDTLIPVIKFLQNTYPNYIRVDHIPAVNVKTKLYLIADLWEHGILITKERLPIRKD